MENCPKRYACPHLGYQACAEAQAEMERLKVENRDLRRVFDQATAAFQEKEAEIRRLKEEAEVLRRKLRDQLQQPFTKDTEQQETAANQEQESSDQPEQKRKKRGAPKGHRGATRKPPDRAPDRIVLVNPCQCPKCHSGNISACQETEEHTQEDLVIIRPLITRYVKKRGYCRDCGALFFPNGQGERPNGYIGPVAVAVAGYLRYAIKIPFDSVRKIFAGLWGLEITPAALVGFDKQLANTGRPFYEQIADMVKYSLELNIDETSWAEGPLIKWLWTFVARSQVLFKIASSRSGEVLRDVLGPVTTACLAPTVSAPTIPSPLRPSKNAWPIMNAPPKNWRSFIPAIKRPCCSPYRSETFSSAPDRSNATGWREKLPMNRPVNRRWILRRNSINCSKRRSKTTTPKIYVAD